MKQTKDQQVKTVVIGLALGVLAQGVDAVTGSKMSLEFAFNHAWRRWTEADRFPSIKGHDLAISSGWGFLSLNGARGSVLPGISIGGARRTSSTTVGQWKKPSISTLTRM
ncbi:hypothetical protein [Gordonia sp. SMJS1]|uniref:hypothetical protein n=1 Tax=Gordonia sp. SMJS1 TaxID=3039400 RepID=UPI0024564512|nr:hypothetical protein [Gordonia sp. SMJS1]WGJ88190.1 hypothetical protein QAD21_24705 [Gordonia sp. SMJS1]